MESVIINQDGEDDSPDNRWEAIIADPKSRPRLDAILDQAGAEAAELLEMNLL